jgi:hypothetical protein
MCASVLSRCCVYFYNGFKCFSGVLQVFQVHVSSVFRRMLQVLHLNVSKVDRLLHFPPLLLLPRLGVSSSRRRLGIRRLLPLLDAGDIQDDAGPTWLRKMVRKNDCRRGRPGASKPIFSPPPRPPARHGSYLVRFGRVTNDGCCSPPPRWRIDAACA